MSEAEMAECEGYLRSVGQEGKGELLNFNEGWLFLRDLDSALLEGDYVERLGQDSVEGGEWEQVRLPHTAAVEPLVITEQQWQGKCFYRKNFELPPLYSNKRIFLRFGAAMHDAIVYLNGERIGAHKGGYLPFLIDLTGYWKLGSNCLLVELTNENDSHIPPAKPIKDLDFNYYGGLYREVELLVLNRVRITDALEGDDSGLIVGYEKVEGNKVDLTISAELENTLERVMEVDVHFIVGLEGGRKELIDGGSHALEPNSKRRIRLKHSLLNPALWDVESPSMYELIAEVKKCGHLLDAKEVRFGVREIAFTREGFFLNGEKMWIRGTNRHQEYPYVGYAIPDEAQYRDAKKIKEAGFDFVRLSHYPQDEAFMDACDELGLLVMNAIPGWQFFGDSIFEKACESDLRTLIRRDRHHPSIVLWESSLNESGMSEAFMTRMHALTHELLSDQTIYTCGWIDGFYDVFIPARQHSKPPDYWNTYEGNSPLFIAEYGDWEYYAQNAGFNQTEFQDLKEEERSSRQLRGAGQVRLAQQALNYQEAHNSNRKGSHCGDANWLMFDYNRGYSPDIESSGIMDIFRLPKFAYYFYQSQRDFEHDDDRELFIAHYWRDASLKDVKVYGNCDSVGLWLNGELLRTQMPDTGVYSTHLAHPPFTFRDVTFEEGTLEARGFFGGKVVVVRRHTPKAAEQVKLMVDESGVAVNREEGDLVFVYARVVDEAGVLVPDNGLGVQFSVEGDGELVGNNPVMTEAGVATILLRVLPEAKRLHVRGEAKGLNGGGVEVVGRK